ncbi:sigma-70 family RNA polymerase sigma factor [Nocardioides aurantiacus]|uniref:RNA polymerase sigma-70 factor (ECF subfamily) n=1 Tax=Nocardioides aurantiacus TaxID=86796 RepID=A0A3N2CPN9_9ACTN|nr:sigma-70 family RNA polymerase sigma factor [Nocardioides aurantiacus]ROR89485.1 RNA polymerase sigma-70 factor (ECF subfamily) [Nocardioides aurantiacus]
MERDEVLRGLDALRRAVLEVLLAPAPVPAGPALPPATTPAGWLLMAQSSTAAGTTGPGSGPGDHGDADQAASSAEDEAEQARLIALVELARGGDAEAFGQLYDHYHSGVFRFLYYRVGSVQLAEDLTSDTFFRALRAMSTFRWQGKDFGAWLTTIARNLTTDHYKAGRTRLEHTTEDMGTLDSTAEGPESAVLASLTNEALMEALGDLPTEQRDCLVMRFLQGLSIAETAEVLGRSAGAVKQLQLRGVRNLAKALPEDLR